ncbi:hypothetical protein AAG747_14340 [Rapidithrix thailandica]|uniref:Uncharacterized protein n=1 Tax=Rapidithrix thailandica TaxID=413964 RepID=A0AAW9S5G2_9BACT
MKKFQLVILTTLLTSLFFTSCSKDDDEAPQPEPSLEEVKFALLNEFEEFTAPQGLQDYDNIHAEQAISDINEANAIRAYFTTYFDIPEGAEKSNTPIASSEGKYIVYKWEEDNKSIALQLSQQGDEYLMEVFIRKKDNAPYQLFIEARQPKAGKKFQLKQFDLEEKQVRATFLWEKREKESTYVSHTRPAGAKQEWNFYADASGKTANSFDGKLFYIIQWDAEGKGSWQDFNPYDGKETGKGSWPERLEDVKFVFLKSLEEIVLPQGLKDSYNTYAKTLVTRINDYKYEYSSYFTVYLDIPGDAEKSTTPVTPGEGEYLVYKWTNKFGEVTVCQVSKQGDEYLFEAFVQEDDGSYVKLFEARQTKDGRKAFILEGENISITVELLDYNGSIRFLYDDGWVKFDLEVQSDGSGKQQYSEDGMPRDDIQWDVEGNGSWKEFDEKGDILDSGSWKANT